MYYFSEKSGRIVAIGYGRVEAVSRPYRGLVEAIPNVYLMYYFPYYLYSILGPKNIE